MPLTRPQLCTKFPVSSIFERSVPIRFHLVVFILQRSWHVDFDGGVPSGVCALIAICIHFDAFAWIPVAECRDVAYDVETLARDCGACDIEGDGLCAERIAAGWRSERRGRVGAGG